jgi:hypothetical protein
MSDQADTVVKLRRIISALAHLHFFAAADFLRAITPWSHTLGPPSAVTQMLL